MTGSDFRPRTEQYKVSSGLTIVTDRWGGNTPHPIMLLHGGGQTRHSWGGTAERLARLGYTAITVDLRGHGESDWHPEGRYQATDFASDIADIALELEIKPVLVGASLGGMTGMVLEGIKHPGILKALVLVDIIPRMEMVGADRVRSFMRANAHSGFGTLEEVADAVAEYNPHRIRPMDLSGLAKNLRARGGRYYWHWDPKLMEMWSDGAEWEAGDEEFMSGAVRAIEAPLLLIRGRMSDLVTEEGAAEFLQEVPHAQYVDVTGAGHMVAGDKNDLFTDAVISFLDQL